MRVRRLFVLIFACVIILQACICIADEGGVRHPYVLGGLLPGKGIEQAYIGARLGSYKPDLRQLDAILKQFNVSAPGAATMINIFARFKNAPQLSYLVEAGYWENETSLKPLIDADLGATFTHISLSFLYYPDLIQRLAPLYLGLGGGLYRLKLSGSALTLLKEVVTKRESTSLGGNFVIGLEYPILERAMVSVQANHIFKNFPVDDEGEQQFSFDGTVVSIGTSVRF